MKTRRTRNRGLLGTLCVGAALLAACGTPGRNIQVDVPPAPRRGHDVRVGEEVGRLLAPDEEISRAAAQRLVALDGEGRDQLIAYAAKLPGERDPRLLNVLDEHHALPDMPDEDRLDFLLWKAARAERFYGMKARSRLLDLARRNPGVVVARLRRGGVGFDVLAVTLAVSGSPEALPALLERYRNTQVTSERAAAAEALAQLVGDARRPRATGSRSEIEQDAEAIQSWYEEQTRSAGEEPPPPVGASDE